jgi:hypothetical protein
MAAALLTTGRPTIANLLPTLGPLHHGHTTSYQRIFSAAVLQENRSPCTETPAISDPASRCWTWVGGQAGFRARTERRA